MPGEGETGESSRGFTAHPAKPNPQVPGLSAIPVSEYDA